MTKKEEYTNQFKWQGLFRGSLLSTTINKHVSYVSFADRRAQGIITINSILIPIILVGISNPIFQKGAIISIVTAFITIAEAIFSLYPKSYRNKKHRHKDLLHFSQIQRMTEDQYAQDMRKALEDIGKLAEMATLDIYHLSTLILKPKFFWLKVSYFTFLTGNIIAISMVAYAALYGTAPLT